LELKSRQEIIDIVQFGSSVIVGRIPNDIDIAVIFKKIPLKEQLKIAQEIKNELGAFFDKEIHIKSYDLYSLFDSGNFAKDSILFYGKSIISRRYFMEQFGVAPRLQIKYVLNKLDKKDKVRFNYLLNGRAGNYGLLREYSGKLVCPGLIEIPPEYEEIFVKAISEITKDFKLIKMLFQGD